MMFRLTDLDSIYFQKRAGSWSDYPCFSSYSSDSRKVTPGTLFLARKGAVSDGNLFVHQAISKGASFIIAEYTVPGMEIGNVPVLISDDVKRTLLDLAASVRRQLRQRIIAVTGSYGKTTTKDMIFSVLKRSYSTGKTMGNLNTEWGVPETLMNNMDKELLVVEMGMDRYGDIDILSRCLKPDVGVITNIGPVHLEYLGSLERVLQGKLGLFREMEESAVKIVNGDDKLLDSVKGGFPNVISYGMEPGNDRMFSRGTEGGMSLCEGNRCYPLPVWGDYNLYNAMAAVVVGDRLGVEKDDIALGLRDAVITPGRSSVEEINGTLVVNDTYNSSPGAVKAVLKNISRSYGGKKILLCLGDMLELGTESSAAHREICSIVGHMENTAALFFGENFSSLGCDINGCEFFTDRSDYAARLEEIASGFDVILFKGSRGMHMEDFLDEIRERL